MIFLTGDTHGGSNGDMVKLQSKNWKEGSNLTRKDFLIILGDCGMVWHRIGTNQYKKRDLPVQRWITEDKPWTTLFLDGNHENHDMLDELEKMDMFGGTVGKVRDHLYHLKRGEIYTIDGKKFFCFGGAQSTDKENRTVGIDWWEREIPNYAEMEHGLENLQKHNNKVDYILSHTCPTFVAQRFIIEKQTWGLNSYNYKMTDPVTTYLNHVTFITKFKKLFFGHWHDDWIYEKYNLLYQNILRIS